MPEVHKASTAAIRPTVATATNVLQTTEDANMVDTNAAHDVPTRPHDIPPVSSGYAPQEALHEVPALQELDVSASVFLQLNYIHFGSFPLRRCSRCKVVHSIHGLPKPPPLQSGYKWRTDGC